MTRRIVVFAAFDKDGIVHNYVLTYLKKLKAVADKIIFIADNEASETERFGRCCRFQTARGIRFRIVQTGDCHGKTARLSGRSG